MPDNKKDFDNIIRDLEDNIFGLDADVEERDVPDQSTQEPEGKAETVKKTTRRMTFPTMIDQATSKDILSDVMKEKNQRHYEIMGFELAFKPYWFFTYTCDLVMKDENGNTIDSEEVGGRIAMDAERGNLADHLQDLLDHEPIELVDLADEIAHVGEAKILEPKISEKRLEGFVTQKISGSLRADKDNVSVAGFELLWAPVYKYWLTIKKRTHNVQIDGCGGYPLNYDDLPLKPKTWSDKLLDDLELLRDPKKWKKYIESKRKGMGTKTGAPSNNTIELLVGPIGLILFLFGLMNRNFLMMIIGIAIVALLFWHMNHKRDKPLIPMPPPPYMQQPSNTQ